MFILKELKRGPLSIGEGRDCYLWRNKDSFVGCLGWGQGCLPGKKRGDGVMRGQPALLMGGDPIPHDTELELQPEDCGPRD